MHLGICVHSAPSIEYGDFFTLTLVTLYAIIFRKCDVRSDCQKMGKVKLLSVGLFSIEIFTEYCINMHFDLAKLSCTFRYICMVIQW